MDDLLKKLIRGCFLGLAVGDALGMPVEIMSRKSILKATGGLGVRDYMKPVQRKIGGTRQLPAGATTDDTQLSLAVARALITTRSFDLHAMGLAHVEELAKTNTGWGRTTKDSVVAIRDWYRSGGSSADDDTVESGPPSGPRAGRSPDEPTPEPQQPGQGCGNGVAMKIAPLAVWWFTKTGLAHLEPFISDAMDLGLMTHGDPRASFAAVALGAAIGGCLDANPLDAAAHPKEFRHAIMRLVDLYVTTVESRYRYYRPRPERFSDRMKLAWSLMDDPDELRRKVGTGCFSLESVPFSIATFLRHHDDFERAVLEAVNAGGDTDTNASMVGALSGALHGEDAIPERFLTGLIDRQKVTLYADLFYEALTEDSERQTNLEFLLPR